MVSTASYTSVIEYFTDLGFTVSKWNSKELLSVSPSALIKHADVLNMLYYSLLLHRVMPYTVLGKYVCLPGIWLLSIPLS